jgi:hypothetical protein
MKSDNSNFQFKDESNYIIDKKQFWSHKTKTLKENSIKYKL